MRVAVLGGGARGVAGGFRQLLSTDAVDRIVLRDTSAERLAQVSRSLGERVELEHHPFPSDLEADAVVVATPRGTQLEAVEAASRLVGRPCW
ncbi:MAG: hypothetical protein Ct9H300mP31_21190 [Acidimicrobiaceae bacterium]|nr:MAG: hypothetical protein Ct9H300mP31_21190 [Acidimicrobiaceae bacterium]